MVEVVEVGVKVVRVLLIVVLIGICSKLLIILVLDVIVSLQLDEGGGQSVFQLPTPEGPHVHRSDLKLVKQVHTEGLPFIQYDELYVLLFYIKFTIYILLQKFKRFNNDNLLQYVGVIVVG